MNDIRASVQRSEESFRKLCKVQQLLFYRKQKLMSLLAGSLTVLLSLAIKNEILSLIVLFLGCWFVVGAETPPIVKAKTMSKNLNASASYVSYRFGADSFIVETALDEKIQDYRHIKYLVEDAKYIYLFRMDKSGYMLDKTTVTGVRPDEIGIFLAGKCPADLTSIRDLKSIKGAFSTFAFGGDFSGKRLY